MYRHLFPPIFKVCQSLDTEMEGLLRIHPFASIVNSGAGPTSWLNIETDNLSFKDTEHQGRFSRYLLKRLFRREH